MSLAQRWIALLEELRRQERYRLLADPCGHDFTSNDYLGYGSGRRGRRESPPVSGKHTADGRSGLASRLLRGQQPIWSQVEEALAQWHGAEAALMFTSGYVANEGLLSTVIQKEDWVASDASNHASIIDGLRLARAEKFIYRHNDLNHLEEGLRHAARQRTRQRELFIVCESLYSMDGDLCPLADLVALAERHGAQVIVDEAHATGCFGPMGSGLVDALGLRSRVLATVHTGGKALGVCGAYVCGSRLLREVLINCCRHFIFTTALPPQVGQWWLSALAQVQADEAGRQTLHANAEYFRQELARLHVAAAGAHYIVPILLGSDRAALTAARQLQAAGWDMRAIRPPSVPPGTARLRLAIHADHSPELLQAAAQAVAQVVLPLCETPP